MSTELKPTPVAEYRKEKRKLVTLSSGFVFEIKKMDVSTMMEMTRLLNLEVPQGTPLERVREIMESKVSDPKFQQDVVKAVDFVVPMCVVSPKIVTSTMETEDTLALSEIAPGDLFELFVEITDFSGVGKMAQTMREKFRDKLSG